jgi:hypothetical protein
MAGAYTVFANNGVHLSPWMLASVRNANGDIVADFSPEAKQVLDPRTAYLTQSLLEDVMNYGTAATARRHGFTAPAAGKTGTSHDAWFAGYTSNLICIVWVGNDDYTDVKIQGADAAAPIWAEFMKRAILLPQYSDVKAFIPPPASPPSASTSPAVFLSTPPAQATASTPPSSTAPHPPAPAVRGLVSSPAPHSLWPLLIDKPVGEDGYYMLTVAENLATTHHLAYNYGLTATGIQPLATFVYAAIAVVTNACGGDPWTLVRAVIVFGTLLCLLFAWQIAVFAHRFAPPEQRSLVFTLAFFLVLFDFSVFRTFIFGLETCVYLCCLAVCITLWHRIVSNSPRWRDVVLLGVGSGFAGLARIDFGLIFALLLLYLLLRRRASFAQVAVCGALALAIVSPWFLFVHRVTGGWMPTSGTAESDLAWRGVNRFDPWARAMMAHLVPWSYAGSSNGFTLALGLTGLLLIVFLALRARALSAALRSPAVRDTFLPWAVAIFLLTLVYAGFFHSTFFYVRYFSPLLLVTVPLLALLLAETDLPQRRPLLFLAELVVLFAALDFYSLHRGRPGNPHYPAAAYVHDNFPDVHVGAFQSGVIGYFNPNVENLDGKLNAGALRAARTHTLGQFIDDEGINVLVDWPSYFDQQLPPGYLATEWQPCAKAPPNPQDICYIRRSFLLAHPEFR